MKAPDILKQAKAEQDDRAASYDAPGGERSMDRSVRMFNVLHGTSLTEVQGWQFMEILKMVRSSQGLPKADNFVDGASYASLAGEAALRTVVTVHKGHSVGPTEVSTRLVREAVYGDLQEG